MADIFNTTKQNISYHIINILKENELEENSTVKEILTVQKEGQRVAQKPKIRLRTYKPYAGNAI